MPKRLENLRQALTLNWGELAAKLEISRAMLDFIRTGARNPSPKILRKIELAEIEAGLKSEANVREAPAGYDPGMKRDLEGVRDELGDLAKRVDAMLKRMGKNQ